MIIQKIRELPAWAQWMPVVIVLLSGLLIGAAIDLKDAKAALSVALQGSPGNHPEVAGPKPSYKDAIAIYEELGAPVSATGVWIKKALPDRIAALREAEAFVAKTEQVFGTAEIGDAAACRAAAIYRKFYVIGLNDLALILEGRTKTSNAGDIYGPVYQSVAFGEKKAECHSYIESLE